MKRYYEKYKHIIPLAIFGVIYVLWFYLLEHRTNVQYMVVHMNIDDYIPFCEYFIIPYFMWFGYIAVTVVYFTLFQNNKQDWWRLVLTLGFGMTLFIVVSFVFPNGHTLREYSFPRENIFTKINDG